MRNRQYNRQGVTAVLAMIFLVLFATLALGFYAATNTNVIVATNEQQASIALGASESGTDFIRYHLAAIKIPPNTPQEQVFPIVADRLKAALEGTRNLGSNTVAVTPTSIIIPAEPNAFIRIDNNSATEFRAVIDSIGQRLRVRVHGRSGMSHTSRAIQLEYWRTDSKTTVFDYAVASMGKVTMQKGSITGVPGISENSIATLMSGNGSSPAISVNGGTIGGELNVVGDGLVSVSGGSVAGTNNIPQILSHHVNVVDQPEFPFIDTEYFRQFATNTYSSGSVLKNVRIPAGSNPKFTGGATIQGILYIESPNTVEFRGNVDMQGFIVFEKKNTSMVNVIDMRGNTSHHDLPAGAEFDSLRHIKGISIMAPTARMTISGSVDSFINGNIILGSFNNGGSADWTIDQGTLLTYDPGNSVTFNGKTVKYKSVGKLNMPTAGIKFSTFFIPDAITYDEVKPVSE
jgi:hypothetical protein